MTDTSPLGAFIRAQRELAELSLRQVAKTAEISNAYLSQVERGLHEPSVRVLRNIADALDISVEQFMRQAGVLEDEEDDRLDVESAIAADSRLTAANKAALVAVYRGLIDESS